MKWSLTWVEMTLLLATMPDYSKDEDEEEGKRELTPDEQYEQLLKIGTKVTPDNIHELFKDDPYS